MFDRLIVLVISLGLVVSMLSISTVSGADGVAFRDISNHWAKVNIEQAVAKGYVSGYPDGTFQPNKEVTRAEFIKMVVDALKLPSSQGATPWYQPYVAAAVEFDIHKESDFKSDYNRALTRIEMVRLAVRATDELTGDQKEIITDNEYMYQATMKGLISGMGKGELAPDGLSTRAQAVVVIERILSVNMGHILPVDSEAVKVAQYELNPEYDPWGRKIRVHNLPKNYQDYPYILADIPNEMYEFAFSERFFGNNLPTSVELYDKYPALNTENITVWWERAERYFNLMLNVDYRTIDYTWAEQSLENYTTMHNEIVALRRFKEYVDYVKENKIVITGKVKIEPTIMSQEQADGIVVRAKVEFKIHQSSTTKDIINDGFYSETNLKIGTAYSGYADVMLGNISSNKYPKDLRVGGVSSLLRVSTFPSKFERGMK